MADATHGFGVLFKIGDGAGPEVFTAIAEVFNVTPPNIQQDSIEVTHHTSPNKWREFIGGLKDGGEFGIEFNWLPNHATQDGTTGILATMLDGENHNYQCVYPSSPALTWEFNGLVTGFQPASPMDNKMTCSATIKISGEPTLE